MWDGCCSYMEHRVFFELVDKVKGFEYPYSYSTLYLDRSLEYGKSYMLATLARLLMKNEKLVIFLPNCHAVC